MSQRVLICGSRGWKDRERIAEVVDSLDDGTIVIEGGAKGADTIAGELARRRGLFVAEVECAEEHWDRFGRAAGVRRSAAMFSLKPGSVIAFWDGKSRGTQVTIEMAHRRELPVEVISG